MSKKDQRRLDSWIDTFRRYNELRPTSDRYLKWCAASVIGSALQRRVLCVITGMKLWPNPYIVLIGGPGAGKSVAIGEAKRFPKHPSCKDYVKIAPDSTTRESFFQQMEKTYSSIKFKKPVMEDVLITDRMHSSFSIMSSELGALLQSNNMPFLRALADLYDCDRPGGIYEYILKQAESSVIINPWLSILGGTTSDDLAEILPKQAMGQGFTSRLILVYSDHEFETDDLFKVQKHESGLFADLLHDYHMMLEMEGEYAFEPEAADWLNQWHKNRHLTMPTDSMLINYCTRRLSHLGKLIMIAAASNRQELVIKKSDCEEAWGWLQEAEKYMPSAIRGIGLNPLSDQIALLVDYVHKEHRRTKRLVRESTLRQFVTRNVSLDKASVYINELSQYCYIEPNTQEPFRLFGPAGIDKE